MIRGQVKLHREGERFAISTNAESERDFLDGTAAALAELLPSSEELARWLPLVVDVAAKMRGYKADVIEKRVIIAGAWLPSDTASVVANGTVTSDQVIGETSAPPLVTV